MCCLEQHVAPRGANAFWCVDGSINLTRLRRFSRENPLDQTRNRVTRLRICACEIDFCRHETAPLALTVLYG